MSKVFRYSQITILFRPSHSFPTPLQFSKFLSTLKQNDKTQKRIEKEKVAENIANLETMADQSDLTEETIKSLIAERRKEINQVVEETAIPKNALIAAGVITLPVLLGGPLLSIFCAQNILIQYAPAILAGYIKYSVVQLNFMAGIHWGYAISEHNCQIDAINSSKTVRNLFIAASVPMFLSFGLASSLVYSSGFTPMVKCLHVGGLALSHLYVFGMDSYVVKNKIAPIWFKKLKLWCSLLSVFGILNLLYVFLAFDEQTIDKRDVYRRFLQTNQERLQIKLKDSK